jgi:hypothetical protein
MTSPAASRIRACYIRGALMAWCMGSCLGVLWQGTAFAQSQFLPYAAISYQYDSNLFALPGAGTAGTPGADHTVKYVAGLHTDYRWSVDQLIIDLEGRRFNYTHNSYLNHNSYLISAKLAWAIANAVSGTLGAHQEQFLEPFEQQVSRMLSLETERIADGLVRILPQRRWHVELGVRYRDVNAPQPELPDFGLRETTSSVALKWRVVSGLELGAYVNYLSGDALHTPETLPYRQVTEALTVAYATGLSSFNASVGYTTRNAPQEQGGNYSSPTGVLLYQRNLTGKTSVSIQLSRAVNTFVVTGETELDTAVSGRLDWKATRKIVVSLKFGEIHSVFGGQLYEGRTDQYFASGLDMKYRALRWLSVRLYGHYERRTSNYPEFVFNGSTVGLEFSAGHLPEEWL